MSYYLNEGLPAPVPAPDGLDAPFWQGLQREELHIQKCGSCGRYQWGPEWICHHCLSEDVGYDQVPASGVIYSYERVWHPVHPALAEQGPYVVVLVQLDVAEDVRVVGNLVAEPTAPVAIGAKVKGVFEHHESAEPRFTLLHWEVA